MKRILLLLMTLVLAVSGIKAAPSISKDGSTITLSGFNAGDLAKVFAGEIEGISASDFSGISRIVFGSGCALNADDFTALNSTTTEALSGVTTVDLSASTVESISTMKDMNLANMEYLRLPDGMTSADDVTKMKDLHSSSKNASLKMAGAYKDAALDEVALYSFVSNSVQGFQSAMMSSVWSNIKIARMAGQYGNTDLDKGNYNLVFNSIPAEWDFTGANFDPCTINQTMNFANGSSYYSEIDPFEEGTAGGKPAPLTGLSNFQTNAFYYFSGYAKDVVKLTLPDQITELPPFCLNQLCKVNESNYKLYYGVDDDALNAVCIGTGDQKGVPLDNLVIPSSIVTVGYECAYNTYIKKITFGRGLKVVQGGAFKQVQGLEDIVFETGVSNCRLGHDAFQLCYDVKHIVLTEGIVSIGAGCFQNSQQMESIRLPESLINIGNRAFDNCLALGSITIPSQVEKIGKRAFNLTPIRDVFLTTTDPDKIPIIYTAGTSWDDEDATFGRNQLWGNNGIPSGPQATHWNGETFTNDGDKIGLTWDQAVTWYYIHASSMAVLHYTPELKDKVMAKISEMYNCESSDGFKLPTKSPASGWDESKDDAKKRANGLGEVELGTNGSTGGIWTQDGWVQFLLMKESEPNEGDRFTKNYKDVWYTMCFPFELTDEQLASAFNEGFNIVDFSGVQIKDPSVPKDNVKNKTLVLHFNKVAETLYKDTEKNLYERKTDDKGVIREKDGKFEYNVYLRNGQEYHHVIMNTGETATTKTKTFAPGKSLTEALNNKDQAILIDGYLASAGHPYMVHPNTGTVASADPVPCHFSRITWVVGDDEGVANGDTEAKSTDQVREELYEAEARTVDLGVENTANNFDQRGYTNLNGKNYTGQKYTFKGNHREFKAGTDLSGKPVEPTPPTVPKEPETVNEPTAVDDPGITLTEKDVTLYDKLTNGNNQYEPGPWKGETEITATFDNGSQQANNYNQKFYMFSGTLTSINPAYATNNNANEAGFNYCKNLFNNYEKVAAYKQYLIDKAKYEQYLIDKDKYEQDLANYPAAQTAYETALENYPNDIAAWKATMAEQGAFVLIPQYAYFLGTPKGAIYPKYFRETAPDNVPRSSGLWSQYAAIIIPNDAALAGLETELGGVSSSSSTGSGAPGAKNHDIAFDEDYFFIDDTPQGIATLIEKIEKEEGKADVEYMDIVVSIDGKIVSRDKTTFEGLPKGIYIINGKKYYVK